MKYGFIRAMMLHSAMIAFLSLTMSPGAQAVIPGALDERGDVRGSAPLSSSVGKQTREKLKYSKDEILVRFRKGVGKDKEKTVHAKTGGQVVRSYHVPSDLHLVKIPTGAAYEKALAAYQSDPDVLYAEPNYIYQAQAVPDDPSFNYLWGLNNTGQTGGTVDADINAPEAWDITTGSPATIIAVIDTGVDYNHQDLQANAWTNPGEVPGNGIDDDGNGYVDDVHGINAITGSGDPMDDNNHGTHVSGTIAAAGNNALGVVGVNWSAKIVACKFLNSEGNGETSDAVECMQYLHDLKTRSLDPVNIIATNNSWGGGGYSLALLDAINAHRAAGVLFIAAAGNSLSDNDAVAYYPANYYAPNVITVAAVDHADGLAWFSSYGRNSVHVAAPGVDVLSTTINNAYGYKSGTSMATPHVAGLVGLLKSHDPSRDWRALKNLILAGGVDIPAVIGKTMSGKRIRAADVNGAGSLTCSDRVLNARLWPKGTSISAGIGAPLGIAVQHIKCAVPNGDVSVTVSDGSQVTLRDDGQGFDQEAGDGVYSAYWTPQAAGVHLLSFPGGDTLSVRGVDIYGQAEDAAYAYRTITGTNLGLGDDQSAGITPPFLVPFPDESQRSTTLDVSSNGALSFTYMNSYVENMQLPAPDFQTIVAPFWDDLNPSAGGGVYWEVIGSAPDRELVVEWRNVPHFSCGGAATFQAVLFENRSDILFNYADVMFGNGACDAGASATVGVQSGQQAARQFSYNTSSLSDHRSLLFRMRTLVADAGEDFFVLPGAAVTLDGSGSRSTDGTIVSYQWYQTAGAPVALTGVDTQTPGFTAPAANGTLSFLLTVTDDRGRTASAIVNVTVNVPPIAEAGPDQTAAANTRVYLDGSASRDPDGAIVLYSWVRSWESVSVIIEGANTATPSFIAPYQPGNVTLTLTVTDNSGQSASDTVVVRVLAPPQASAGADRIAMFGAAVALDGSGSYDLDGTIAAYRWRQISGTPVALAGADTAMPGFTAPHAVDDLVFELTVTDDDGFTSVDMVTARVLDDYSVVSETSYSYRAITGTRITLGDNQSTYRALPFPIHFGDDPGSFENIFFSSNGAVSFTDGVYTASNAALPAAGFQSLIAPFWDDLNPSAAGGVYWDVIGSAPNREIVIEWRSVPHVACGGAVTFQVVLFEDRSDILFNYADVMFGNGACDAGASATVGVQMNSAAARQYSYNSAGLRNGLALLWKVNAPPTAGAGPDQTVLPGSAVALSGAGSSDPDGAIVSYQWTQTAGTPAALIGADTATPSFIAPSVSGTLTFELTVSDIRGATAADTVNVTVNIPPNADAGPDMAVVSGSLVSLNGTTSVDSDGTIVSYHWEQTAGTAVVISGPDTPMPSFVAPAAPGTLTFRLTVTDDTGAAASDTVDVVVSVRPVANAGPDQTVIVSSAVGLNGAGSYDPDGMITGYAWTQTGGTPVALTGADTATPGFIAPAASGTLLFQLTVTDNSGLTSSDTISIVVNAPPAANAGPDRTVKIKSIVTLDGTGSHDPDGTIASYLWTQTGGTPVALSGANTAAPSFTAPGSSGTLTFRLTVEDDRGASASDEVNITVTKTGR